MINWLRYPICMLLLLALSQNSFTQMRAINSNYQEPTQYSYNGEKDTLYFFNERNGNYLIKLQADSGYTSHRWFYTFSTSYTEITSLSDTVNSLNLDTIPHNAGVLYIGNGTDSVFCWVYKNLYNIQIAKDEFDTITDYTCSGFELNVTESYKNLHYYNPHTQIRITKTWKGSYTWTTIPAEATTLDGKGAGIHFVEEYHWEDTRHTVTFQDSTGKLSIDSAWVPAIVPKAELAVNTIPLGNRDYYPGYDDWFYENSRYSEDDNSAPIKINIINEAKNTDSLVFRIYNDANQDKKFSNETDTLIYEADTIVDSLVYLIEFPGNYYVDIIAKHYYPNPIEASEIKVISCKDQATSDLIEIVEATLGNAGGSGGGDASNPGDFAQKQSSEGQGIPNVITIPDGNFYFDDASITQFEIIIFNQYGKRVHKFEGNIRNWPGWDGRINESNRYVATGVYYYVVRNLGLLLDISAYMPNSTYDDTEFFDEFFGGMHNKKDKNSKLQPGDYLGWKDNNKSMFVGFLHVYNTGN